MGPKINIVTYSLEELGCNTMYMRSKCALFEDEEEEGQRTSEEKHTGLPPITGLRITFGTYTKALGTMGR